MKKLKKKLKKLKKLKKDFYINEKILYTVNFIQRFEYN